MNEQMDRLEGNDGTLDGRFLTFQVGKETFGIEIRYVVEIVGLQPVTEMPEMPEYIIGIIDLRGKIVPVMDVRLRFKMSAKDYDDRTSIIIIEMNGTTIGLVIDNVAEVVRIDDDQILKMPEMGSEDNCGYVKNIGRIDDQIVLLIDSDKLLTYEECSQMKGRKL